MAEFVHLHVHSDFSLLDGLVKVDDLVGAAADLGMPALALTDHGVMFGALHFYHAAKKAGIKPLVGCEIYIAPRGMTQKARLTYEYMQASLHVYRQARQEAQRLLEAVQDAGYGRVRILGDTDLAEICYLTCLEQGLQAEANAADVPTLQVEGMRLVLNWPDGRAPVEVRVSPWVKD